MLQSYLNLALVGRKDMPHELEIDESGQARMFYAGEVPWHKLGKGVEKAQTSAKAIQLAGLGKWNVHLERFTAESGGVSDEWRAIVRGLDKRILGVATQAYQPIQNEQMFDFMDSLVADRIIHYHTAGSLMGGRKVWLLAQMESDMRIGADLYTQYLLLVAGHDNFTSLKVFPTQVRVVCNNTLMQATRRTPAAVRVTHSGDIDRKFERARAILNVTTESQRRMEQWMKKLLNKKISDADVTTVREQIFGSLDEATPARRREAIERFMAIYEAEKEREGRTGYTVLQTVTGYGDHMINLKSRPDGDEKLISAIAGTGLVFKQKGIQILSAVAQVPAPPGLFAQSGL
jgi:phage/plasmid-like protein (TIGR03299 family)